MWSEYSKETAVHMAPASVTDDATAADVIEVLFQYQIVTQCLAFNVLYTVFHKIGTLFCFYNLSK